MATTTRVLTASVNGTVYTSNANGALEAIDTCHSGTTAPTNEVANGKFWLDTTTTPAILKIYNNAAWSVVHQGADVTVTGSFTSQGIDDNATSTAMTLDASGNLLVGKTTSNISTAGFEASASFGFRSTRSGNVAGYLNRTTSDGSILAFAKDGSTVGSIGSSNSGYNLFMSTSDTGLAFNYLADEIVPCAANGAYRDASIDLGDSSARFKDLYLSGGVYLGGTVAANKLDGYEEGTWTPTITFGGASVGTTYSAQVGNYTKVGNLVTAACYIVLSGKGTSTGAAAVTGLPFTSTAVVNTFCPATLWLQNISFADMALAYQAYGTSSVKLQEVTNAGTRTDLVDTNFAIGSQIMVSVSYRV